MTDSGSQSCSVQVSKNKSSQALFHRDGFLLGSTFPSSPRIKLVHAGRLKNIRGRQVRIPAQDGWVNVRGDWGARNHPNVTNEVSKFLCISPFPVAGFCEEGVSFVWGFVVCVCARAGQSAHVRFSP